MSNILTIIVTEFRSVVDKSVTYGYTARDGYGEDFEDGWPNLSDFLQRYPNRQTLIDHIRGRMDIGEDSVTRVDCDFPD